MALRTVAAKLKAPLASLKQAWAVCHPQAKHPLEDLNVDPIILQEMKTLERAVMVSEMKQALLSIGFMGGVTGALAHVLRSDLPMGGVTGPSMRLVQTKTKEPKERRLVTLAVMSVVLTGASALYV